MGKKSRKNKGGGGDDAKGAVAVTNTAVPQSELDAPSSQSPQELTAQQAIQYASDGPSDVELLQTTCSSLQAKLDQLTNLGLADDRSSFVAQFVPLDVSPADAQGYLEDLTTAPEAEGQWRNLVAEIAAIRCGRGVDRIDGDQMNRAVFYFKHPLLEACDREVGFCFSGGEWRAEG